MVPPMCLPNSKHIYMPTNILDYVGYVLQM